MKNLNLVIAKALARIRITATSDDYIALSRKIAKQYGCKFSIEDSDGIATILLPKVSTSQGKGTPIVTYDGDSILCDIEDNNGEPMFGSYKTKRKDIVRMYKELEAGGSKLMLSIFDALSKN